MKKPLFGLMALAVALVFPTGVFAQNAEPTKAPMGEKTQTSETKTTETSKAGKKTTKKHVMKKKTTKKGAKGTEKKMEEKKTTTEEEKK